MLIMRTDYEGRTTSVQLDDQVKVLDKGFVSLRDVMGSDSTVCADARITTGSAGKDDRALLRYLFRKREMGPLEQAHLKFHVKGPMDMARQMLRYRSAHVQEYSTRYREAILDMARTEPDRWRLQSESNKQGSAGCLPASAGKHFSDEEEDIFDTARLVYRAWIAAGAAREQARKILPLSTYTEFIWTIDLRNLIHFLSERMDPVHPQEEIRQYATVIGEKFVAPLFPYVWEAFNDYDFRRGGLLLSAADIIAVDAANGWMESTMNEAQIKKSICDRCGWPSPPERCREREECFEKLRRLGLL